MRILWFTNTPSNASEEFGYKSPGGGWISSLETLIVERKACELSICFFYYGDIYKKVKIGDVVYHGIPINKSNVFKRVKARHLSVLEDEKVVSDFKEILDDTKPDLIQVFGTENSFGKLLLNYEGKVLFHLQGLVCPYSYVFYPPGFNKFILLLQSKLSDILLGRTFNDNYNLYRKMASREVSTIKNWKYFTGRTNWDRNYIELLNSNAQYFHCEELLRKDFFKNKWQPPSEIDENKTIVLGTTINSNIYKGLDLIYKVIELLSGRKIVWKVFGFSNEDPLNKTVKRVLKINKQDTRLIFSGSLNAPDLIKELMTCHFFVHPSYIDNSPNSVCEAMLLGMPVISSSVGGIKSLINDGVSGFLFNPYDKYDLAGLLVHLTNNYENAIDAGKIAREIAMKRHSPDAILFRILEMYSFIIKNEGNK